MKRSLLVTFLCLSLITVLTPMAFTQGPERSPASKESPAAVKPAKYEINIVELANAQMYRYGREMFRLRNYAESARVFLEIIRLDCNNKVAQYHLQKIAENDRSFAYLADMLKKLPCGAPDFEREDFLPASFYYEKDTDLMLEQIVAYHKRQRMSERDMKAQAEKYAGIISKLEANINALINTSPYATPSAGASTAVTDEKIVEQLESRRKIAYMMDKQIAYLKSEIASQRLEHQKEVQDMRTRLAEVEAKVSKGAPETPEVEKAETYSPGAKALMAAIEKAKAELKDKENALADKDKKLATLQERFDDILRRLKLIQDNIALKNAQIKALLTNLQDIQKP